MNSTDKQNRIFKIIYVLARVFLVPVCRVKTHGKENIPDGPALFCANHSSFLDPFVICFSLGKNRLVHFVAKAELFRIPVVRGVLKALGMIPVDRSTTDTGAVKESLRFLRAGERVGIFPEGTRVSESNAVAAKMGAVKLAAKTGVPIVPIYIPRKKSAFRTTHTVIGAPYTISSSGRRLEAEDYKQLSEQLMDKIEQLKVAGEEG